MLFPAFSELKFPKSKHTKLIRVTSRKVTMLRIFFSLLLLGGDIHPNPGPAKFPCGICSKPVKINQRGTCCDLCDRWYHTRCCLICDHMYDILANSSSSWICCDCGFPNFSDSLFDLSMECNLNNNSFSLLSSIDSDLSNHFTPNSKNDHIPYRRGRKENLRKFELQQYQESTQK